MSFCFDLRCIGVSVRLAINFSMLFTDTRTCAQSISVAITAQHREKVILLKVKNKRVYIHKPYRICYADSSRLSSNQPIRYDTISVFGFNEVYTASITAMYGIFTNIYFGALVLCLWGKKILQFKIDWISKWHNRIFDMYVFEYTRHPIGHRPITTV